MPITYRECEYQYYFAEFLLCNCATFDISKDEATKICGALPEVQRTEDIAYIQKSALKKIPISSEKREHFWSIVTSIQHDKDFQRYCKMLHAYSGDYDYEPPDYDYRPPTESQPREPLDRANVRYKVNDHNRVKKSTSLGSACTIQTQDLRALLGELRAL